MVYNRTADPHSETALRTRTEDPHCGPALQTRTEEPHCGTAITYIVEPLPAVHADTPYAHAN